ALNRSRRPAGTGSAPQNPHCQAERSTSAISSGLTLRRHSAKAKAGPPLILARYWEIARSHEAGLPMKSFGLFW
ncbi:MAG: hypothetical protein KDE08_16030, partial [Rhodobacteraceae bacterium]|nr:hypothetical protein [Paracoccaceae bacterium]